MYHISVYMYRRVESVDVCIVGDIGWPGLGTKHVLCRPVTYLCITPDIITKLDIVKMSYQH